MADNVAITAGSGTSIATDQNGSDHVQWNKLYYGANGSFTAADHAVGSGFPVAYAPVTHYHRVTTADTNAVTIKASVAKLRGLIVSNAADYWVWVKFHDSSSTPTAGVAVVMTVGVPGYASLVLPLPGAKAFAFGLGMTVVKGAADANAVAVAAADATIEVFYE